MVGAGVEIAVFCDPAIGKGALFEAKELVVFIQDGGGIFAGEGEAGQLAGGGGLFIQSPVRFGRSIIFRNFSRSFLYLRGAKPSTWRAR